MTKVLIGIPTFRRAALLADLLSSIEAQEAVDGVEIAVFVADNDPNGTGRDVCARLRPGFRWALSAAIVPERGIAGARNAILARAQEQGVELVAMLDDDERADAFWLSRMLAMMERTGADVIGGPVLFEFKGPVPESISRSGAFPAPPASSGMVPMIEGSGNILLSCRALEQAGSPRFDLAYGLTGGEDMEFFLRLKKKGLRFAWANDAIATEGVAAERLKTGWILKRAFRCGNCDMRIPIDHRAWSEVAVGIAKSGGVIVSAPVLALLLLSPSRRLWLLRRWSRTAGRLSAIFGFNYKEYAARPD